MKGVHDAGEMDGFGRVEREVAVEPAGGSET